MSVRPNDMVGCYAPRRLAPALVTFLWNANLGVDIPVALSGRALRDTVLRLLHMYCRAQGLTRSRPGDNRVYIEPDGAMHSCFGSAMPSGIFHSMYLVNMMKPFMSATNGDQDMVDECYRVANYHVQMHGGPPV